jgi:CheY-like chemotaxis protein
MQNKKVLVVNDDAFQLLAFSDLLTVIGVDVIVAEDGKQALDLYIKCNGDGLSAILMNI